MFQFRNSLSVCQNYILFDFCVGGSRKAKALHSWPKIKHYYAEHRRPTRLSSLTLPMTKLARKITTLRTKAAECRQLAPFAAFLAEEMSKNTGSVEYEMIHHMFKHLLSSYMCLGETPFNVELARSSASKFCIMYSGLSRTGLRVIYEK